ncbi:MAG: Nramp family divalent metal transporter [Candidatus Woesearchaeota archaeon]
MLERGKKRFGRLRRFFKKIGPGFITGASDDDPSGIATYSQTGAKFGYTQSWMALFVLPFMTAIQEMCGRIGVVTGKGLAGVMKKHYSRPILYFSVILLLIANVVNIGADLGAMAASAQLLFGIPFVYLILGITLLSVLLEIFVSYHRYVKVLKYLCLSLLAYIIVAFVIKIDWSQVLHSTFIPHLTFSKDYLFNIVAFLGTTISPYLFFWQTSEEVEEEVDRKALKSMGKGIPRFNFSMLREMRYDTLFGMFFSQLVTFFIIIVTASTLGAYGITDIQTADQAAMALKPLAGNFTYLLFAIGIIGVGLLAIPVLAGSASYALAETFRQKEGLYLKFKQAHFFYGVLIIATVAGLMINFINIPPFKMLYYAAVVNGIIAPALMVMIMLISNNKEVMGNYTNSWKSNLLGWIITGVMIVCALALLVSLLV